jgi:hypothetical protein
MSAVCSCGLNKLDRSLIRTFYLYGCTNADQLYMVGQLSKLHHWAMKRMTCMASSQYIEGLKPGEINTKGIRHEDVSPARPFAT